MKPGIKWRNVLIGAAVSAVITLGILTIRGYLQLEDYNEKMAALSDGFFVPGVLFLGFGLLVFIADDGFFDIFSYGMLKLVTSIRGRRRKEEDGPKDFYEYREAKHGTKKGPFTHLFFIGALDIALAVLFLFMGGELG